MTTSVAAGLPTPAAAPIPERTAAEQPMVDIAFEGYSEVRVGIIGLGNRGLAQLKLLLAIEGARVTAVFDLDADRTQRAVDAVRATSDQPAPAAYSGSADAYLELVARDDIDLVYVATPWEWHHPQAKAAMDHGKHVSVELPIATTLDDIWDLVRTSERTGRHCMLCENSNYARHELRLLRMVKEGLFGELLHGAGGYVHDLRHPYLFGGSYQPEGWRRRWQTRTNANHYPMHGLAPVAACMGINRGDRFERLLSVSSPARALAAYRSEHMPADHPSWEDEYVTGDRTTCFIQTAGGRFLRSEHEVNTPHPYSRANSLVGTHGAWTDDPQRIYLESLGHTDHQWRDFDNGFAEYDHWLWREIGDSAERHGGHGGMDFITLWRTIQLMRLGLTPDIDVYDSAALCSVVPLSATSIELGSQPVAVPDFTRGHWQAERPGLERERPDE